MFTHDNRGLRTSTTRGFFRFSQVNEIIDFSGVREFIDSPIKYYSSGMYVRLGFAISVMVKPDILIVDEVIAVGDEEFQRKCIEHLYSLRKAGTTMVMVSHGLGSITDLCDEAAWLETGYIKKIGPARDVTKAYLDSVNAKEAKAAEEGARPRRRRASWPAAAPARSGSPVWRSWMKQELPPG